MQASDMNSPPREVMQVTTPRAAPPEVLQVSVPSVIIPVASSPLVRRPASFGNSNAVLTPEKLRRRYESNHRALTRLKAKNKLLKLRNEALKEKLKESAVGRKPTKTTEQKITASNEIIPGISEALTETKLLKNIKRGVEEIIGSVYEVTEDYCKKQKRAKTEESHAKVFKSFIFGIHSVFMKHPQFKDVLAEGNAKGSSRGNKAPRDASSSSSSKKVKATGISKKNPTHQI